ncbi:MotA/TolQ/ExbB proton channel family protein [Thalassotalea mangrovi]|uniref:MotA/TolQ/ExbB proton channel family protein n=1 Tax=Thalassotalea mangrovi TaxID=2572245 RepID=A0A4U1B4Q1_9GAMM|nr:MotA/TolQ/ExbB proton channel family protein [Thalassotalea mangrovi]TKB44479.1 MotA/TolQ/ExbB proton channel family protein [Thalassotalea mangrovi]
MLFFIEMMNDIREFMDTGGQVLLVIAAVVCLMWLLIFERLIYIFYRYRGIKKTMLNTWQRRTVATTKRESWNSEQIRQALISRGSNGLNQNLPLIHSLVVLCPLLGLLGTVTGMIEVFDVMAISGSGNARSMASGVSKATIPTMAGMVGSLSGVFASSFLQRFAKRETELLEDAMPTAH